MVNVYAYDIIDNKLDKNKTWINVAKQMLLSREINYYRFYTLAKRYNSDTNSYNYFIILANEKIPNSINSSTNKDNYGRIKIRLNRIFVESGLSRLKEDRNINIELISSDENSSVYKLDI